MGLQIKKLEEWSLKLGIFEEGGGKALPFMGDKKSWTWPTTQALKKVGSLIFFTTA